MLSFITFRKLIDGEPGPFAILFSLGNLTCIMA